MIQEKAKAKTKQVNFISRAKKYCLNKEVKAENLLLNFSSKGISLILKKGGRFPAQVDTVEERNWRQRRVFIFSRAESEIEIRHRTVT